MSNFEHESGDPLNPKANSEMADVPETESRPFSQQVGARVFVRTTVLKRLAKAGVRDERDPMTNAINDRLDYVLTSQDGWSSTLFDLAGAELTLANRLDELNIANLEIARLLTDLDSKTEEQQIQQSFRGLVNMSGDQRKQIVR